MLKVEQRATSMTSIVRFSMPRRASAVVAVGPAEVEDGEDGAGTRCDADMGLPASVMTSLLPDSEKVLVNAPAVRLERLVDDLPRLRCAPPLRQSRCGTPSLLSRRRVPSAVYIQRTTHGGRI